MARTHTIRLKIRQLREAAGMTQGELAREVGVTQTALSGYEHSAHMPPLETAAKIADVLGCTIDEMIWRPDMTSVRLKRLKEIERRNAEHIREWEQKHEDA